MEVLIVAKTHMKNGACIGALDLSTKKNIRLLNDNDQNQPKDTDFEIGQVWDLEYHVRQTIIPPHVEDVIVTRKTFLRKQKNLNLFLLNNVNVWKGDPRSIFDNKIDFPIAKSGYVTKQRGIPSQSVGFWLADKDLELTILDDQKHYFYFGDYNDVYVFPYVGYADTNEKIRKGSIIRVSLARWWSPTPNIYKRCYCQLSGWYE
jgi:hypothetical protein